MNISYLSGFSNASQHLHWHPDHEHMVYATGSFVIIAGIDDPKRNQVILRGHTHKIDKLLLSPDGSLIASAEEGEESDVLIWSYESQSLLFRLSEHDNGVTSMAFSSDTKLLFTSCQHRMACWDLSNGNLVTLQPTTFPILSSAFGGFTRTIKRKDTDNYQLVVAGSNKIVFWDIDPYAGQTTPTPVQTEGSRSHQQRDFTVLQFSPDFEILFCGTSSGDVSIIHVKTHTILKSVFCCYAGVSALVPLSLEEEEEGGGEGGGGGGKEEEEEERFTSFLFVGGKDGSILKLRLPSFSYGRTSEHYEEVLKVQLEGSIFSLSLAPDKLEILAGTSLGAIHRLTCEELLSMIVSEHHTESIVGSCLSYDDQEEGDVNASSSSSFLLATVTGGYENSMRIWDSHMESLSHSSFAIRSSSSETGGNVEGEQTQYEVTCFAFSGEVIITGWNDGQIRSYDLDGQPLWHIPHAHKGKEGVSSLSLSHNGRFLVSGGYEGDVRLWELRSRELVSHLKEHNAIIKGLVLYKDDIHLLSCSRDRCIMCWDLPAEQRITSHRQRMGGVNGVVISKDEMHIVSISQERTVSCWDLREQTPLRVVSVPNEDEQTAIAINHEGSLVVTGGMSGNLYGWHFPSLDLIFTKEAHSPLMPVTSLTFSIDDQCLYSTSRDGSLIVWKMER